MIAFSISPSTDYNNLYFPFPSLPPPWTWKVVITVTTTYPAPPCTTLHFPVPPVDVKRDINDLPCTYPIPTLYLLWT